jgi:Carbamoyl-phosphate synthase small chain, CPSase domain
MPTIMRLDRQAASIAPSTKVAQKAVLVLEDGTVFRGRGLGLFGQTLGEVCFNTSMTGCQEILSDPSYAGQIITFTFPHIGNVGTNDEDIESRSPSCRGLVLRSLGVATFQRQMMMTGRTGPRNCGNHDGRRKRIVTAH